MKKPVAVMVVLVLASSTAIAFASIPSANGVIHGCFRRADGRLRVINRDVGRTCRDGERSLSWNRRGRRGLQGLRGPRGLQGIQGPQGEPGVSSHALTEHIVASFTPATEPGSSASWTQPADTIARVYWRVIITTPRDPCQSAEAANVNFILRLNGFAVDGPSEQTVGPAETKSVPAVGSFEFSGGNPLFPGQYELRTETSTVNNIAPDCLDTTVETEVFVETVA
jgi:hypothetical protein